ncbi:hypothetical protein [Thalassoroseus pseudoceratinae]|uniref:hypothetical protein n=1 Tax=Thalassoroseus pseudoceratinae TaxID=2713176 RepID=UPI00141F30D7|nr:hypothetical protein [Thalassoroseus pseudoceratinae]
MAGYFLYTLDHNVFSDLTMNPTREHGQIFVDYLFAEFEDLKEEFEAEDSVWPSDKDALIAKIVERLASPDWYSDLSYEDACIWDTIIGLLDDEPGEQLGIDFQCSDYESIYWDCADIAAEQGATMMAEPKFGNAGFRYFGKPESDWNPFPMYSFYLPEKSRELLAQLKQVEPHFRSLSQDEGEPGEQFFKGLLPVVESVVEKNRVLWVQTDT